MSDIAPLLILLLCWFFFGSRISKIKKIKDAAKAPGQKPAAAPAPKQKTSDPRADIAPVRDPEAGVPVRAPISPTVSAPSLSEGGSAWVNDRTSVGSLGEDSMEGIDPCHDEQAQEMTSLRSASADPDPVAPPELTLSWARNDVVRGFVYGEILNRRKSA